MTIVEVINKLRNQHLRGFITDAEYASQLGDAAIREAQSVVNRYTVVLFDVHGDYTTKMENLRLSDVKVYFECGDCDDHVTLCPACEGKVQFLLTHGQVIQSKNLFEQIVSVFKEA